MSLSQEIIDGVNRLSGSARDEYGSFVGGWWLFMRTLSEFLNEPLDDLIRDTYDDVSASDFVEILILTGWKPNPGESTREFDKRLRALPIFAQLGLKEDSLLIEKGRGHVH
jgi:hypothetical protein